MDRLFFKNFQKTGHIVTTKSFRLFSALRPNLFPPASVAHGNIAVVTSQKNLAAFREDVPIGIQTGIDGGLGAAGADILNLCNGVRQLHQALRAREEVGQKVRAKAKTEDRDVCLIHNFPQLINLLRG